MKKYPEIYNQTQILKDLCYEELNNKFNDADKEITKRLDFELDMIHKTNIEEILLCLHQAVVNLGITPSEIMVRGTMGNSLVVYLLGLSCINPIEWRLHPYLCFGINERRLKELIINISLESSIINSLIKELENNDYINKIVEAKWKNQNGALEDSKVKYFIIPKKEESNNEDLNNIINYIKKTDSHEITEYYTIYFSEMELLNNIKFFEDNINDFDLQNGKNINFNSKNNFYNNEVTDYINYCYKYNKKCGIWVLDSEPYKEMCKILKPKCFNDFVKILSLAHGSNTWSFYEKYIFDGNTLCIENLISNRDEVFDELINHGISIEDAFFITEDVRKGKGIGSYKELLEKKGLSKLFIDFCDNVEYLFPKAHAINYMMIYWKILWYKLRNK